MPARQNGATEETRHKKPTGTVGTAKEAMHHATGEATTCRVDKDTNSRRDGTTVHNTWCSEHRAHIV